MIVEYIRYKINQEKQADFVQAYKNASEQLDNSEYCLGYELTQCEEVPEKFILRIEWTSTADHLNGFRRSTAFRIFFKHVSPFFNDIEEMNHYQSTGLMRTKREASPD